VKRKIYEFYLEHLILNYNISYTLVFGEQMQHSEYMKLKINLRKRNLICSWRWPWRLLYIWLHTVW